MRTVEPLIPGSILAATNIAPIAVMSGTEGSSGSRGSSTAIRTMAAKPAAKVAHHDAPAGPSRPSIAFTSGIWHIMSAAKKNMAAVSHLSKAKSSSTVHRNSPTARPSTSTRMKRRSPLKRLNPDMSRRSLSYTPNITNMVDPLAPGRAETAPATAPAAKWEDVRPSSGPLIPALSSCAWTPPMRPPLSAPRSRRRL